MDKINLKGTDLNIAPIIFGGNVFGWTLDQKHSFEILDSFVDLGFDSIDTANQYSFWVPGNKGGESESILGEWMKERGNRDRIVMMTKVGGIFASNPSPNTTKEHIITEVENSLKRLQTDYIDLYQTHFDQLDTPVEETLRAYEDLVQQGKVRYIGASNLSPERLRKSIKVSEQEGLQVYKTLQPEYNLYSRAGFEQNYKGLAEEFGLSVIPYYSLASGFLTAKYQHEEDFSKSVRGKGIQEQYWNTRGEKIVKALIHVAQQHNTTASAVALAWLLAQPTVAAPIASATKSIHLKPFLEAVGLKLSGEEVVLLNGASSY